MATRRVVTGHTPEGVAIVASDGPVEAMSLGPAGAEYEFVWARDDVAHFPDDGSQPPVSGMFPPPGGCALGISTMPPGANRESHEYLRDNLPGFADPDDAGMHRTATIDFEYIIEGTVTLELDDGVTVDLGPGDVVVQNGTRHRWSNNGDVPVKFIAVTIGAEHAIEGGKPVR
jgi:mannose-6-phosphate isomerase-like protein (cupin superfamily)